MLLIPLKPVPNQNLSITLGGQNCFIELDTKLERLYFSIHVNNQPIITNVLCHDRNLLVDGAYHGFIGNLFFEDLNGTTEPVYAGLMTRYALMYADASELP
jgi:hypothetical protein